MQTRILVADDNAEIREILKILGLTDTLVTC